MPLCSTVFRYSLGQEQKTDVIKDELNPEWNKVTFYGNLTNIHEKLLQFSIYHFWNIVFFFG